MKAKEKPEEKGLSEKVKREVEKELGVYLVDPHDVMRCGTEQYGVLDEDEKHAGDIQAPERFFTRETLVAAIKKLFNEK